MGYCARRAFDTIQWESSHIAETEKSLATSNTTESVFQPATSRRSGVAPEANVDPQNRNTS